MDFFHGQETLTIIQWILRACAAFVFMMIIARVLGQRTLSQLRLLDFVIALIVGNIIAHPLSDEKLGLEGSMITTIVLVILYLGGVFGILKFPLLRKILNNSPVIVVQDGRIINKGLKKARISIDILLEELREAKAADVKKVALAIWEADGKLSVFLDPQYEAITPALYKIQTEPLNFPRTIIKEGKIITKELEQIHKDEDWVISNLENLYKTGLKNVLLGTVDNKGNLTAFLYK